MLCQLFNNFIEKIPVLLNIFRAVIFFDGFDLKSMKFDKKLILIKKKNKKKLLGSSLIQHGIKFITKYYG